MEVSYSSAADGAAVLSQEQLQTASADQSSNLVLISGQAETETYVYTDKPVYEAVKRVFDVIFSIVGLVVASPIMLATAIAIKLEDGGPVVFRENCIGRYGKPVVKLKFRSMKINADEILSNFDETHQNIYIIGGKIEDDPRITKVGRVIRKSSIDELMQFISIIKGDLSFVGPRIINTRELEFYGKEKGKFLSVMPGLTGWWQVNGRSNVTYEHGDRQRLELYYIDHRGMMMDAKILFMTVGVVLRGNGAR